MIYLAWIAGDTLYEERLTDFGGAYCSLGAEFGRE
jgi:hypothetical protein